MEDENDIYPFKVIGNVSSCFNTKNGTPRQSMICPNSQAQIKLRKGLFTNPEHAIDGIEDYTHIWIVFIFHQNKDAHKPFAFRKAKVKPPRLNGRTVGVFATRSPHRPNPLGLTLAKLVKVTGNVLFVSGIDIVDGTPIIDVKPYIPKYDVPLELLAISLSPNSSEVSTTSTPREKICVDDINNGALAECEEANACDTNPSEASNKIESDEITKLKSQEGDAAHVPHWIRSPQIRELEVVFTPRSENGLRMFHKLKSCGSAGCEYCLSFFTSMTEAKDAICNLLKADPRSVYRRAKCTDRLYFVSFDTIHLTCWFDKDDMVVEVLKVKPISHVTESNRRNPRE